MFSKFGGRFDTEFYLTYFLFSKKGIFYIQCKNVTNNRLIFTKNQNDENAFF